MPRTLEYTVYQFSELSAKAKEKARDWYRELIPTDFADTVSYEQFETAASLLGITLNTDHKRSNGIFWSGFSSQGDGASFEGSYSYVYDCSVKIREEFPTDTTLHKIADDLTRLGGRLRLESGAILEGMISRDGRYCHSGTMDVDAKDARTDDLLDVEVSNELRDIMRRFADWIYRGLEAEYDYQMSDEAVDESIEANEYEFEEDGSRA